MNPFDGGPAFPSPEIAKDIRDDSGRCVCTRVYEASCGMSLREWYAGQALNGYLSGTDPNADIEAFDKQRVAACCCAYADAVIAELKKGVES